MSERRLALLQYKAMSAAVELAEANGTAEEHNEAVAAKIAAYDHLMEVSKREATRDEVPANG